MMYICSNKEINKVSEGFLLLLFLMIFNLIPSISSCVCFVHRVIDDDDFYYIQPVIFVFVSSSSRLCSVFMLSTQDIWFWAVSGESTHIYIRMIEIHLSDEIIF